jgi:hypothetical protein
MLYHCPYPNKSFFFKIFLRDSLVFGLTPHYFTGDLDRWKRKRKRKRKIKIKRNRPREKEKERKRKDTKRRREK